MFSAVAEPAVENEIEGRFVREVTRSGSLEFDLNPRCGCRGHIVDVAEY